MISYRHMKRSLRQTIVFCLLSGIVALALLYAAIVPRQKIELNRTPRIVAARPKIFVIGYGKTGTSTLARTLRRLGFTVGDQRSAQALIDDYAMRNWSSLLSYIDDSSADAFQDIPFSLDFTFQILDIAYPKSKFILSVRSSGDVWFNSLRSFHSRVFAHRRNGSGAPTIEQLQRAKYQRPGWIWDAMREEFFIRDYREELYNKDYFISLYTRHNSIIRDYFKNRPNDFLEVNVEKIGEFAELCRFLRRPYPGGEFPRVRP